MSELGIVLLEGLEQTLAHLDGEAVPGARIQTVAAIPDETDSGIQRAPALVGRYAPTGACLADELASERHSAAETE